MSTKSDSISTSLSQGKLVQAEIDERIAKALTQALVIQLCGEEGKAKGYGQCLVIQANDDSSLGRIRSQLGNVLAEASRAKGLRAVGMIAYREVCPKNPIILPPDITAGNLYPCGLPCRHSGRQAVDSW